MPVFAKTDTERIRRDRYDLQAITVTELDLQHRLMNVSHLQRTPPTTFW